MHDRARLEDFVAWWGDGRPEAGAEERWWDVGVEAGETDGAGCVTEGQQRRSPSEEADHTHD